MNVNEMSIFMDILLGAILVERQMKFDLAVRDIKMGNLSQFKTSIKLFDSVPVWSICLIDLSDYDYEAQFKHIWIGMKLFIIELIHSLCQFNSEPFIFLYIFLII